MSILKSVTFQKLPFSQISEHFLNLDRKIKLVRNVFLRNRTSFQRQNCILKHRSFWHTQGWPFFLLILYNSQDIKKKCSYCKTNLEKIFWPSWFSPQCYSPGTPRQGGRRRGSGLTVWNIWCGRASDAGCTAINTLTSREQKTDLRVVVIAEHGTALGGATGLLTRCYIFCLKL